MWAIIEMRQGIIAGNPIPGAVHTDLYDYVAGVIPYDKMEDFFNNNLK